MAQYRKKPVVIEAFKWTGDENQTEDPEWIINAIKASKVRIDYNPLSMKIITLEGIMAANPGDFIIKGVQGEFYPCKPDIFEKTYEEVWD
jgi:hypothetical protein